MNGSIFGFRNFLFCFSGRVFFINTWKKCLKIDNSHELHIYKSKRSFKMLVISILWTSIKNIMFTVNSIYISFSEIYNLVCFQLIFHSIYFSHCTKIFCKDYSFLIRFYYVRICKLFLWIYSLHVILYMLSVMWHYIFCWTFSFLKKIKLRLLHFDFLTYSFVHQGRGTSNYYRIHYYIQ